MSGDTCWSPAKRIPMADPMFSRNIPRLQLLLLANFLCGHLPAVSSQEFVDTMLERPYCPGEMVTLTCVTQGSLIIAWNYVGISQQLELSSITNVVGDVVRSRDNSANATLTGNTVIDGVRVLTSKLIITASSQYPTSSVSCVQVALIGTRNTTQFQVIAAPSIPQHVKSVQALCPSSNKCYIVLTWQPPNNNATANVTDYCVYVDDVRIDPVAITDQLYAVEVNCADHNVSISAANTCGKGPRVTELVNFDNNTTVTIEDLDLIELLSIDQIQLLKEYKDKVCVSSTFGGGTTSTHCLLTSFISVVTSMVIGIITNHL